MSLLLKASSMSSIPTHDHLKWEGSRHFAATLAEIGSPDEEIKFSGWVDKINNKGYVQPRVLVVTDLALYNFRGGLFTQCKRRIDIRNINSIVRSKFSHQFIVCCPEEYDYHYSSLRVSEICDTIVGVHRIVTGNIISVDFKITRTLFGFVLTKKKATKHKAPGVSTRTSNLEYNLSTESSVVQSDDSQDETSPSTRSRSETLYSTSKDEVSIDSFKIMKVLGKGAFGKVYLVQRHATAEVFAMKVLNKNDIVDPKAVEHTTTERHVLEAVQHPFIVSLRYAFQTEEKFYIVMEFLNGGELFYHLKCTRRFKEDRACFYASEITLAIGHLHSLGIVYRDLKPENVLLDSEGHVKITDFGLAKKAVMDNKSASTFCGTPEYIAPEILSGSGHGRAADWWSLGTLIYEMLCGLPPFYHKNVNIMYDKILNAKLSFPAVVSPTARDILTKLLERDPEKRLGSGKRDCEEIKEHPFFASVDWKALFQKNVKAPFTPPVKGADDVGNFDTKFTNERVTDGKKNNSKPPDGI